jgi:porin
MTEGFGLGFGYRSESAWDIAGGKVCGGTYAGQENLSFDLDWEKLAKVNGFSTHIDVVSVQGQNLSREFVGDVLYQAQQIYGTAVVEQTFHSLGVFLR